MSGTRIKTKGVLGLDTGGTFTDLVFISDEDNKVLAKGKTPTIHNNLVKTIENGMDIILEKIEASAVRSFSIATTLATNAIVENRTRPTALILIGYDEDIVLDAVNENAFNTEFVYMAEGGHDNWGNEKRPLDTEKIKEIVSEFPANIEAVAVSGYFSVRNNAHENAAVEIIKAMRPELFITCGYDLSTELNAIKRATTAVLNAGLIPITIEFFDAVQFACRSRNINSEINVVKGDGSIAAIEWARLYPVEMILSGPAGSACGAQFLRGSREKDRDSWVIDIGGTTTDIIRLDENGRPVLLESGITVAGHKTLTRAIDIYTFGLGGDSRVLLNREKDISLDSRRVIPVCRLAEKYPKVIKELKLLKRKNYDEEPLFILTKTGESDGEFEQSIAESIAAGPRSLNRILEAVRNKSIYRNAVRNMYEKGYIEYASFTPTDALNVSGELDMGNTEASALAAEIMADGVRYEDAQAVAEEVRRQVIYSICMELEKRNFESYEINLDTGSTETIKYALGIQNSKQKLLELYLNADLIGVGAPSWAFLPEAGKFVNETAVLPEHAEVAGAVGAAMGSFFLSYAIDIIPVQGGDGYRVHYPAGIADFDDAETAVEAACDFMKGWLTERAVKAGATVPDVKWIRKDEILEGLTEKLELRPWIKVIFTATE